MDRTLRFRAKTWTFPAENHNKPPDRVVTREVDVEISESFLSLGDARIPISEILSAELHTWGMWPLRNYALALVVKNDIVRIAIPTSIATMRLPFDYTIRRFSLYPSWLNAVWLALVLYWILKTIF